MRYTKAHAILEEIRDFTVTNISELAEKVRFLDGGNRSLAFLEEGDSIARDVLALAYAAVLGEITPHRIIWHVAPSPRAA